MTQLIGSAGALGVFVPFCKNSCLQNKVNLLKALLRCRHVRPTVEPYSRHFQAGGFAHLQALTAFHEQAWQGGSLGAGLGAHQARNTIVPGLAEITTETQASHLCAEQQLKPTSKCAWRATHHLDIMLSQSEGSDQHGLIPSGLSHLS